MSKKHLSALALVLVIVVGAIFLVVPEKTGRDNAPGSDHFLSNVGERINQVTSIVIKEAGDQTLVSLQRADSAWAIENLSGYPANWDAVREFLAGITQSRVVEQKTANPGLYSRLGVEDVTSDDASGMLVELVFPDETISFILGNKAENRSGRYARMSGEAGSVLIDFEADVPTQAKGWADNSIVDIAAAEVGTIEITHADGETITLGKISADESDYLLQGIPAGREIQSSWTVNSLGGALSALTFDDVISTDNLSWDGATSIRVLTFGGLQVNASLVEQDGESWISLGASTPYAIDETDEVPAEIDGSDPASGTDPVVGQADTINERVTGWAYRIPSYKAEALSRRMQDLLKSEDEEASG